MGVTILALLASFALVAANAFFVASEFALVKMRPTRLEQLAGQGHRRARLALGLSRHLDAYLSATQLGITIASLALGWLGEPAFARLFARLFGLHGGSEHVAAIAAGLVTITFLHTVLGELAPKSLALRNTEGVTLWTAVPLRVFYLVAFPLIWTLNGAAALVLRLLGLRPANPNEHVHSPEELRLIMHRAALEPGVRRLIDRVFDYTERSARDVMIARRDVTVLETGTPIEDNVRRVLDQEFSRYPVIDSDTGGVLGYVHIKDLMAALIDETRPDLATMVREPVYATESVRLEQLRREFQRRRVHLAVIRDRHGAFSGIVTLEDLLEEFVGDIQDEQDVGERGRMRLHPDGGFEADGRVTIDAVRRDLGVQLPSRTRHTTLSDEVVARLGHVPHVGDQVDVGGHRLVVLEVRDRAVRRLHGEPLGPAHRIGAHPLQ